MASVGCADGPAGVASTGLAVVGSGGSALSGGVAGGQQRHGDGHRHAEQAQAAQRLTAIDDAVGVVLDDL